MLRTLYVTTLIFIFGISQTISAQNSKEDQELIDLALKISNELYKGNYQFYDDLFYLDSLVGRVLIDDGTTELAQFNEGFTTGFAGSFTWAKSFYKIIAEGGLYEPVSFTTEGSSSYITFSQFSELGLNYHELELKKIEGKLRIIDVYVYVNGEPISETLRLTYLSILKQSEIGQRLEGDSKSYLNDVASILDFNTLVSAKEWGKLDGFLEQTSDAFKQTKFYYNFKVLALSGLGDYEKYYEFLKENASIAVPSSYLTSLDVLTIEQDWPALHQTLNTLDDFVGGDPILNNFRANAFLSAGDFPNARASYQLVYDDFPDYNYGIIGLLTVGLESGDAALSVNSFVDLHDRFGFTKEDIQNIAASYPVVNESAEFKKYVAGL